MCFVRSKTKMLTSKSLFEYSFNTYFVLMIYSFRLRQIEILNSYRSFDKSCVELCVFDVSSSSSYIQKSTNKSRKSIETLRDNCNNTATTCQMIETFEYSWSNSLTTIRSSQQLNYSSFSSIRVFTLAWASHLISLRLSLRESDFWSSKQRIWLISCRIFSTSFVITRQTTKSSMTSMTWKTIFTILIKRISLSLSRFSIFLKSSMNKILFQIVVDLAEKSLFWFLSKLHSIRIWNFQFDVHSSWFKIFFRSSIFLLRFCVTYSQNLRRIENWIVSKTSSETVVRFYWTLKW